MCGEVLATGDPNPITSCPTPSLASVCAVSGAVTRVMKDCSCPPPAISPDGLLCQCREQRAWQGCRSTLGVSSGRHYFETMVTDEGLCRVGWATSLASHELGSLVSNSNQCPPVSMATVYTTGKDRYGFGFGGTGKKSFSGQFDDYGEVSHTHTLSSAV